MKTLLLSLYLLINVFSGFTQTTSEKIDQLMQAYHSTGQYNGVVLVADHGEVIFQKAYGYQNYADSLPHELSTKFRISSMTKQFTALLILQYVQEGKLKLSDKITDHLPYYRKSGDSISIHQLLSHQSGIPNISSFKNFRQDSIHIPLSIEFLIQRWCMGETEFKPGSTSRYSNSNYMILGGIVEVISGHSFEEELQEKILDPLGMKNTGLVPDSAVVEGMATGYIANAEGFTEESSIAYSNLHAAGQMYSTVYDLFLWDRALANNQLLNQELTNKMYTPYLDNHGYGWKVYRRLYEGQQDSCTTSYHAGGLEGFSSFIQRFHERNMVMIFMANTNRERRKTGTISDDIIYILFNLPYELPLLKESIPMELEAFHKFMGTYEHESGRLRQITYEDSSFVYVSKRARQYSIHPESDSKFFFSNDHRSTIKFEEVEGNMTMTVHTPKRDLIYYRK